MSTHQQASDKSTRLQDEHEHLREVMCECHKLINNQSAKISTIISTINELVDYVDSHFQHEEKDGYFKDAIQVAPRFKDKADHLLCQHPQLLKHLNLIQSIASSGNGSNIWWETLGSQFDDFLEDFLQHEHRENALIQKVYNEDIGAAD